MKKYKLIIFDLDGTLLDSLEGIGAAMNAVLAGHELPGHTKAEYRYFVGNGLKKLAERALPAEVFARDGIHPYYEELVKAYETHYKEGLGLYPGIAGLLDRLTEAGYQLAVNSNKIDYMVKKIAIDYLADWKWAETRGATEELPIKPSPAGAERIMAAAGAAPEETLYVGDSEVDMATAQNAGIDSAFVSWGFRRLADLEKAGAEITYIIDRPEQLTALLCGESVGK